MQLCEAIKIISAAPESFDDLEKIKNLLEASRLLIEWWTSKNASLKKLEVDFSNLCEQKKQSEFEIKRLRTALRMASILLKESGADLLFEEIRGA